ncbi:MAG: FmdB family zinc ribbon protein [Pseudomonadales bacterium]
MPVYEYRCGRCSEISSVVSSVSNLKSEVSCEHCGGVANHIISRPSVHLSKTSKLERLDPKYDKMVDKAMSSTQNAEPDRILKRMKPFSRDG